ncbi:MAG: hypothetical protein HY737_03465 [Candidatus Omnitrophica bacterium]|nr:hypothetical protein [Candidatus Omnitrophota bacterium]
MSSIAFAEQQSSVTQRLEAIDRALTQVEQQRPVASQPAHARGWAVGRSAARPQAPWRQPASSLALWTLAAAFAGLIAGAAWLTRQLRAWRAQAEQQGTIIQQAAAEQQRLLSQVRILQEQQAAQDRTFQTIKRELADAQQQRDEANWYLGEARARL